ncbi:MAG TPA: transglutaminase-like domain-containing protein [bacterium]
MKKVLTLAIAAAIIIITVYLVLQIPRPGRSAESSSMISDTVLSASEEWLGMYIHGERIGYTFTKLTRTGQGLTVESRSQMTIFMMQETRSLATTFFAHTNPDYTLKDFSLEINTAGHPTKIEGSIENTSLKLTSYSQGVPQTKTFQLKEKPFFPDAIEELIKTRGLKPGDEISLPYFDPTTQSQSPAQITIFEPEDVLVNGVAHRGTKVQIRFMGIITFMWLDKDFKLIKEYSPALGLEMIPLSKDAALAEIKPDQAFDLLSFFAVKVSNPIPERKDLSYMKLELKNIEIGELQLADDYQILVSKKPLVIELSRPDIIKVPALQIPINDQTEFLKSSVYIQSDNRDIINAAHSIIGNEKDAAKAAEKLVHGVFKMLAKNPTPSLPSALDVLKTKEGDCNEHAILFTALARAVGIPAKIYVGLVNIYGDSYWYHAWCAVWLGSWVAVDPTFDQFPADVYHLKLMEGEIAEQAKVLTVVGKLGIDILEYK